MIGKKDSVTPSAGLRIRLIGVFDFNKLYKDMRDWFQKYKYDFQENENSDKFKEIGREIIIKWTGERKVDDYAKFEIKVEFFMEKINPVKIGNEKAVQGTVTIKFWANVLLDYTNKWQTKPLGSFLFKIYNNYIIKNKIQNVYETNIYNEVIELEDLAKEILDLYKK